MPRLPSLFLILLFTVLPAWTLSLRVASASDAPVRVGQMMRWQAVAVDAAEGDVWYRYRVRGPGRSSFSTVRDFSSDGLFEWVPLEDDGIYEVEIAAKRAGTGAVHTVVERVSVLSHVTSDLPVITPTANELVFLYSAPPCPVGSTLKVVFNSPDGVAQSTPAKKCTAGRSVNIYLAGLRAETLYSAHHSVTGEDGQSVSGPELTFTTGALQQQFAPTRPLMQAPPSADRLLFQNRVFQPSVVTDMQGNIVWYYRQVVPYLTRPEPGGYFFALIEKHGGRDEQQILRSIDVAGNTVWETNAGAINQRLIALGKRPITSFHHEARRLPDGRILVLAANERMISGLRGSGDTPVIGDAILVLNIDFEVDWFWDAFDYLNVGRPALLDEKCAAGTGGCPVFRLGESADDWLHGNSLSLSPDGHLIYSARHQDWIYKIDYANGIGSGSIIWRFGKDGDFRLQDAEDSSWFSHQHDANYVPCEFGDCLLLFDNGNIRAESDESVHSRGQLYYLDENARTARLLLNVDLGDYAFALGSAQRLTDGNFHFNLGWDTKGGGSQALEYNPQGQPVRQLGVTTQQYRSHRMKDMYTP